MWDLARFPHSSITQLLLFVHRWQRRRRCATQVHWGWAGRLDSLHPYQYVPLCSVFSTLIQYDFLNLSVWQAITHGVACSQYLSTCSLFARADTFCCHSWHRHSTDVDVHKAAPLQFTALPTGTSPTQDGSLWEHPHSWVSWCLCPKSQHLPSFQGLGPWLYLSRDPSLATRCCLVGTTWPSAGVWLQEHTFWLSRAGRSLIAAPPLWQPKFDQGSIYF